MGKRHRGRRETATGEKKEERKRNVLGTGCTRYTYVCMYTHSAAAEAVTLIAVFSNSKEEELLPVPSVGTRGCSRAGECGRRVDERETRALSLGRGALVRKRKEKNAGWKRAERKMHEGPRLITRELTRRASSTTSSTWQPAQIRSLMRLYEHLAPLNGNE